LSDLKTRDESILRLLRAKQYEEAFAELERAYATKLLRVCLAYFHHKQSAEDATQESLMRIWRALRTYDERQGSLFTWAYQIAQNCCHSIWKDDEAAALAGKVKQEPQSWRSCPETEEDRRQNLAVLLETAVSLPKMQARVLLLYYFNDLSVREVAEALGIPAGTVKTHLYRGRLAMRGRLRMLGLPDDDFDWR
jgi:RNA polymerase sigma-70 factor, ECF subfamily